jgi:hypothetical protein
VTLPFTAGEFLDVFGRYNLALGPGVVILWVMTLALIVEVVRGRSRPLWLSGLLALHWAWSGIAYHAAFFSRINPAAWLFAVGFLAQACAFAWVGMVQRRLTLDCGRTRRHALAGLFLLYSLAYPVLVVASGHRFPNAPAFAVPCPTTLFTAGILLATASPVPRWLLVVPVLWSLIGGSAALLLGMAPDLMLFVAGASLVVRALKNG